MATAAATEAAAAISTPPKTLIVRSFDVGPVGDKPISPHASCGHAVTSRRQSL
jgi:hypothetical protein